MVSIGHRHDDRIRAGTQILLCRILETRRPRVRGLNVRGGLPSPQLIETPSDSCGELFVKVPAEGHAIVPAIVRSTGREHKPAGSDVP